MVKIKPLNWQGEFAHTTVGILYRILEDEGFFILEKIFNSAVFKSGHDTVIDAQNAAQKHLEKCINELIEEPKS